MLWFNHDTSAADDDKIVALRIDAGGAAVDAYWAILEAIYRDETDLVFEKNQPGTKALSHRLVVGFDELESYVKSILGVGLLTDTATDEERESGIIRLHSNRAESIISEYEGRRETARRNGRKGGRKPKANQVGSKLVPSGKPKANQTLSKVEEEVEVEEEVDKEKTAGATERDSGFSKPTLDDVESYFAANCLKGDPSEFYDYYESQGWNKSNGMPVSSWMASARMWHRKQRSIDAERAVRGEPTPDEAMWTPAASADPKGDAERAQEEYERAVAKLTPEERRRFNLG